MRRWRCGCKWISCVWIRKQKEMSILKKAAAENVSVLLRLILAVGVQLGSFMGYKVIHQRGPCLWYRLLLRHDGVAMHYSRIRSHRSPVRSAWLRYRIHASLPIGPCWLHDKSFCSAKAVNKTLQSDLELPTHLFNKLKQVRANGITRCQNYSP